MSSDRPDRYSARPLPAYRHRPGRTPHPLRDPRGHSYASQGPDFAPLDPSDWARCEGHLHAVDLFNHGYWWEAHEVWEELWRGFERGDATARILQGLIQLCDPLALLVD